MIIISSNIPKPQAENKLYFESSFMKSCRKQKSKLQIWPNSNEQCNIEGDLVGKEIFPPLETFLDKKKFLKFLEVYLQT